MRIISGEGNFNHANMQVGAKRQKGKVPYFAQNSTSSQRAADVYTCQAGSVSETKNSALTAKQAGELAKRYDVKNMTQEEYHSLLKELKDQGLISLKDMRTCGAGEVPYIPIDGIRCIEGGKKDFHPWPASGDRADFTKILSGNLNLCRSYLLEYAKTDGEREFGSSMTQSYTQMIDLFQQISDAREIQQCQK